MPAKLKNPPKKCCPFFLDKHNVREDRYNMPGNRMLVTDAGSTVRT
jgi:hypothetical protein